ncbi:Mavicyanin [Apostasia shenzhenica]|uniref:Mavicyanin n=1 Tax=Apostasia shenzhenica TaxID=1088818 RepID=A0A2I0B7X1_9ASPA|nr:Mavicyanin [Apostasia shenzhenica]
MAAASLQAGLMLVVMVAAAGGPIFSAAKVYTVGDSQGWTTLNSPNYTAWASNKVFHVGDTVVFKYNNQFHNVLEVKQADFTACKNNSALSEFTTGDDSILIKNAGHHYFICGFPFHCRSGQRVDILAISSTAPSTSPAASPSGGPGSALAPNAAASPSGGSGSAPAPNAASRLQLAIPVAAAMAVTGAVLLVGF